MSQVAERWAAIESNPEVLTELCHRLGASDQFEVNIRIWLVVGVGGGGLFVCTKNLFFIQVVDVFSMDPEMLMFIPRPVLALYLLFPSRSDGERIMMKYSPEKHR